MEVRRWEAKGIVFRMSGVLKCKDWEMYGNAVRMGGVWKQLSVMANGGLWYLQC
jgi:hypothetical protein